MSATDAPRARKIASASAARARPCSPAPRVISRPRTRSSAITGQGLADPNGVIVPRWYPVACRATLASGMDRRLTPSSRRSFGQEMVRSPGTSTNRKSSSPRCTTSVLTTSAGATPRARAASAKLRTGPCRITRWESPAASAASSAGVDTVQYPAAGRHQPPAPRAASTRRRRTMTDPVLMVVDGDPGSLATLEGTLRRRYGHDYLIIGEATPGTALGRLRELRAAARPVAVVLAAAAVAEAPAADFFAQTRSIQPAAKRVLVIPREDPAAPSLRVPVPLVADRQAATPVLRAIAHGMIDAYLPAPGAGRDEGFHRAVSELLEEWAHEAAPVLPAVRIVAQQGSARAHELRDLLARNGVPYVFHTAESAEGRSWLQQVGAGAPTLPIVVMYTGEVLVDPSNERLADAFGLASLPATTVDVAIVGAGPAGLSAAVYTASEGMSTLVLEREAIGGQAGSSSLIRNFLGFPRGISGASLATRAFEQAWSFGATTSVAGPVTELQPAGGGYTLD